MNFKKYLYFFLALTAVIIFSTSCGGSGGLKNSSTSQTSASNDKSTLGVFFAWPDYSIIRRDPRCIASLKNYQNQFNKTIPSDTDYFQIHLYQHPYYEESYVTGEWYQVLTDDSQTVFTRTQYPGSSVTLSFKELNPGETRIYTLALFGTPTDYNRIVASYLTTTNLVSGVTPNVIDATLGDFYFIGTANSNITSVTDTITVPAGTFNNNCVKMTTDVTATNCPGAQQKPYIEGQRITWYADGVGLIKLQYAHNDGSVTTATLQSCSVGNPMSVFWPFVTGNTWTYVWNNTYYLHRTLTETYTVNAPGVVPSFQTDIPPDYDPTDPNWIILQSSSNGLTQSCIFLLIDNATNNININSMNQLGNNDISVFPLSTWSVFGFFGLDETIFNNADHPLGKNYNSNNIKFGNPPQD